MSSFSERPIHALIVEDNRDWAHIFASLIELLNCTVDVTFTARDGLEMIGSRTVDIVFCDLRLPGSEDGFHVAQQVRANPTLDQIPLIAVTGVDDATEHDRAIASGFLKVVKKPIKFRDLQELLDSLRRVRGCGPKSV